MSASFHMLLTELQKLVKSDIIGNIEKASIASILWSKYNVEMKTKYKAMAKDFNVWQTLTGRRKITGFWWFAGEFLDALRMERICEVYIEELFEGLDEVYKDMFIKMNAMSATKRYEAIFEIFQDETNF